MRDAMWRGNGGWEIAATPALVGFLGFLLDGSLDTRPIFTILGACIGLFGAVANQYYRYVDRMNEASDERVAARKAKFGAGDGIRFGAVDVEEMPDYALESDLVESDAQ